MQRVAVLGDEDALLVAARSRDEASFEHLIRPYLGVGFRLAMAMLRDPGESEDVLQDAMLRAWRSIGQVRSAGQVRGWFLTIVANRSRSVRRTRRWSEIRSPEPGLDRQSPLEGVDQRADLVRALQELSPEDRAVVYLRFYEDMSTKDLAEALGLSGNAARTRLHRALQRLRIRFVEEEDL